MKITGDYSLENSKSDFWKIAQTFFSFSKVTALQSAQGRGTATVQQIGGGGDSVVLGETIRWLLYFTFYSNIALMTYILTFCYYFVEYSFSLLYIFRWD